jgi:hypothetical protein
MAKKNKRAAVQSAPIMNTPAPRTEFNPDYTMVKKDLKRIGLLAGFFVIVLVSLSFFLK